MTVTVGRFGRDITTPGLSSVQSSGRTLRLSGFFKASTLVQARVLRQQLMGAVGNPDEPVVPVTCSEDPDLDGYYRVTGADVSLDVAGGDYTNFRFPWSCELERVTTSGFSPMVERTIIAGLRTNGHSIALTSTIVWFGVPYPVTGDTIFGSAFSALVTVGCASGESITVWYDTNPSASIYTNRTVFAPSGGEFTGGAWYTDSATIESKWADNSTYYAVAGRDMPARVAAAVAPGHDWRLSNGLMRVTPTEVTGGNDDGFGLSISHWDGSAWDTAVGFNFTIGGNVLGSEGIDQVVILRNDPAAVSIRCRLGGVGAGYAFDLTLRRGSAFVEGRMTTLSAAVTVIARDSVEACTALTGGIRATSNDASGNRFFLGSAEAATNDLTNGKITSGSLAAFNFVIGSEVGGTTPSYFTAQNHLYQYFAAQSETYRMVGG
jgi:hypothetical protein